MFFFELFVNSRHAYYNYYMNVYKFGRFSINVSYYYSSKLILVEKSFCASFFIFYAFSSIFVSNIVVYWVVFWVCF
jgi:hypothetical protein